MFVLKTLFSRSNPMAVTDLKNTKMALHKLGYYTIPPHRDWTDDSTFNGLESFQRDNGLKVDGLMRPGGPTEASLNRNLMRISSGGGGVGGGNSHYDPNQPRDDIGRWTKIGAGSTGYERREQPQLHAMPRSSAIPGKTHSTHPVPDPDLEWEYFGSVSKGKKLEKVATCGPIRVDEVNPTFGIDGKYFSINWHDRTADGQTITPIDGKNNSLKRAVLGGLQPMGTRTRYYESPFPRMEGGNYTAEVDFPPDKDYNRASLGPYLNVYVPKKCKGIK